MIANGAHSPKSEHREAKTIESDEQVQLIVQPNMKQLTIHTDFDIKYEEDDQHIALYVELNPKDINSLTKEATANKRYDDIRKSYANCIFYRPIQTPYSSLKGSFRITYVHYKGLSVVVEFDNKQAKDDEENEYEAMIGMQGRCRVHYQGNDLWDHQWLDANETSAGCYGFNVKTSELDKILKQKLLLQIDLEKNVSPCRDFIGIVNEGNTCYANSTLQVLYHFKPLQKMIVEIPKKKLKKVTRALQEIFVDLMTSSSSVRAEQLLKCFRMDQDYGFRRQQDIHEFLMSFFSQLQAEMPEACQLWTGKDYEVTFSKDKKYTSKQEQNFTELLLYMADTKGTHFYSINESLKQLLEQDKADEPIDTEHGKLQVYKVRAFCALPPLLFMNIKRYEYDARRRELKKINLDLGYPAELNLDYLMKTPQGLEYVLYAVVVHKGRSPNSGHYFCFVNVSDDPNRPDWYEFNDSRVKRVTANKVLKNYTGKARKVVNLNKQYGKWVSTEEPSQQTAYLLAYIRRDQLQQFQSIKVELPSEQLKRIQDKITEEQAKTMTAVKLYVFNPEDYFKPFEETVSFKQVKLTKDQPIQSQIKKEQKILGCKVGSIWKVNNKTQTMKYLGNFYGDQCKINVSFHTENKRGVRKPDYFMVVPEPLMGHIDNYQTRKLGLLHVHQITENDTVDKYEIITKQQIAERLMTLEKSGSNITYDTRQLEYFVGGWNDYLKITKQ